MTQRDPAYVGAEHGRQLVEQVGAHEDVVRRGTGDVHPGAGRLTHGDAVQHGQHLLHDRVDRQPVGLHDVRGHRLVDRRPLVDQLLHLPAHVAQQQGPGHAQADTLRCVGEPDPEEHDPVPVESGAGARVEHGPSADGQHAVVLRQRGGTAARSSSRKCGLTGVHEDVGDRLALGRLDVLVGVPEADAPASARRRPTVVLPAPIGPTRTTCGRVTGVSAASSVVG